MGKFIYQRHRIALITLSLFLTIMACQKDEIVMEREYPRFDISEDIVLSDTGVVFNATFHTQNVDILDKGFVWARGVFPTVDTESHVSLGGEQGAGTFSTMATFDLLAGVEYYVHAYAITSEHLVYSKAIPFISTTNGIEHSLDSFMPVRGNVNDTIVLFGSNLSYHKERIEVLFSNVNAEILSSTDTTITVTVPVHSISKAQIRVKINKVQKAYKDFFYVNVK